VPFVVSLLTPFDARGRVDLARLRAHVLWLGAHGVDGFITAGSAGEFLFLSDREREAVQRTILDAARDKIVFPCTWDPSPTTTAYLIEAAMSEGARAALLPPPLFYHLDDVALSEWYASMAPKGRLLAFHDPERIPTGFLPSTYGELLEKKSVVGMVDQSGDPWRLKRLAQASPNTVWAANDRAMETIRPIEGLAGFVSVLANAWPSFCVRVWSGETELAPALVERAVKVEQAGGLRALKSLLRMGCRAPMIEPNDDALAGLPSAETP
jgi:dihydrodipicolinate synthase/N-acetylneuraminate lyase